MARGFVSGMLSGSLMASGALALMSVATSLPDIAAQRAPASGAPEVATAEPVDPPRVEPTPEPQTAEVVAPTDTTAETVPEETTAALDVPADSEPNVPQSAPETAEAVAPQAPAPAVTVPPATALAVPTPESGSGIAVAQLPVAPDMTRPGALAVDQDPEQVATLETQTALPQNAPDAATDIAALAAPEPASAPDIAVATDTTIDTSLSALPQTPQAEAPAQVVADPALPSTAPAVVAAPSVPDAPQVSEAESVEVAVATPAPRAAPPSGIATPQTDGTQVSVGTDPTRPTLPQVETPDAPTVVAAAEPAPQPTQRAGLPVVDETVPEPEVSQSALRPGIGKPASRLEDLAANVATGKLPTVRRPGAVTDAAVPAEDAGGAVGATAATALTRFAQPVDVPADAARVSVILIDDLKGPIGANAVDSFPFPVTFAVDAGAPGAQEAMRTYRDKGFEVVALASLPAGARAADVEVALQAMQSAVPEAVALLDTSDGGLQGNSQITQQVADYAAETGQGVVFRPRGLNSAATTALRDGVRATTVFRELDGQGEGTDSIRRALDQAAFRARQDGSLVLLGRLRADTVSALLLWGLNDRADNVVLVPVSQVLTADAG